MSVEPFFFFSHSGRSVVVAVRPFQVYLVRSLLHSSAAAAAAEPWYAAFRASFRCYAGFFLISFSYDYFAQFFTMDNYAIFHKYRLNICTDTLRFF